jgi:putative transposase
VLGWHCNAFRLFWTWKIRRGKVGRPAVPKEVRQLIRTMSHENPIWGAPRLRRTAQTGHQDRRNQRK